jgi:hypothetical protein
MALPLRLITFDETLFCLFRLFPGGTQREKNHPFLFNGAFNQNKPKSLDHVRDFTGDTACHHRTNYLFLWPTISLRTVRRSTRVRFFSIAGVSNEICGISQRCSAMNQVGFSVAIQLR